MSERSRLRLVVIQVLVLSLLLTLAGRLWYLQVYNGAQYTAASTGNSTRDVITPAVRGLILDDQGRPLAQNRTALVVSVSRTEMIQQKDLGKAIISRVARVIRQPFATVWAHTRLCGEPGAPKPPVCWNGSPYQPIPVDSNATQAMALEIAEHQWLYPGVTAELTAVRQYPEPDHANAAQVLGYLGAVTQDDLDKQLVDGIKPGESQLLSTDLIGRSGLEEQYDSVLRGSPGVTTLGVDKAGGVTGTLKTVQPTPGDYLVTSLDAKVQAVTEQQLYAAINRARTQGDPNKNFAKYHADSGAAVVMDVTDGRVIALASWPSYDPNIWVGGISDAAYKSVVGATSNFPILSRAFQGSFAPGSTFKVVSLPAAVKAGYSLNGSYECGSSFMIGNTPKKNFESEAFGMISLKMAIEVSCDTVFYRFAYETWLREGGLKPRTNDDPFVTMAKAYGFGRVTGVDLPGEVTGRIADRAWKQAYWEATKSYYCQKAKTGFPEFASQPAKAQFLKALSAENCTSGNQYRGGDAANFVIGQGDTTVTPLQLASVYAAVANGGTLYQPEIGKAIVRPDGTLVRTIAPKVRGKLPVDPTVLSYLQEALLGVTTSAHGTGKAPFALAKFPQGQISIAAKTGTAEVYGKDPTSWFATYAPADKPRYAVVMMVSQGGTGSGISGPSVEKIYEALFGVSDGKISPARTALPNATPPVRLPPISRTGIITAPHDTAVPNLAFPLAASVPPTTSRSGKAASKKSRTKGGTAG